MAIASDSGGPDGVMGTSTNATTWSPESEALLPSETQLPKNATLFERVRVVGERIKHGVDKFFEEFSWQRVEF